MHFCRCMCVCVCIVCTCIFVFMHVWIMGVCVCMFVRACMRTRAQVHVETQAWSQDHSSVYLSLVYSLRQDLTVEPRAC